MKRFWMILAAFLGLAVTAIPASANVQFTLDQGGSLGPDGVTYGTVTAVQLGSGTSSFVRVEITLAANNYFIASGSHVGIGWDMSTVPTAVTIFDNTPPNNPPLPKSDSTKFTVDALNASYTDQPFTQGSGLNPFNYGITPIASSGGSGTEQSIIFDITKPGIGIFLSNIVGQANTLFTKNGANGYYFAADIGLNCSKEASGALHCAGGTGVVAANSFTDIPEPGTWTMSIAGLAGLTGLMMLRRRRKTVRA